MRIGLIALTLIVTAALAVMPFSAAGRAGTTSDVPAPEGEEYEQAELDFVTWCGPCHGRNATGNGPVAVSLKTPPPDLTRLAERDGGTFPGDAVRARIDGRDVPAAHGTPEMPVWGYWFALEATAGGLLQDDRETAEKEVGERIERLVNFLETLQKVAALVFS